MLYAYACHTYDVPVVCFAEHNAAAAAAAGKVGLYVKSDRDESLGEKSFETSLTRKPH